MQELFASFLEQLDEIEKSSHPKDREHQTARACKSILKLVDYPLNRLSDNDLHTLSLYFKQKLAAYAPTYGDWLDGIPALLLSREAKDKKRLRRYLNDFTHLVYLSSCLDFETEAELIKRIRFAKTLKELDALENGRVIQTKQIEPLAGRLKLARKRDPKTIIPDAEIKRELKTRRRNLQKKNRANIAAAWLTAIISSLGVGLVSGIAMVLVMPLLFPAIPIGGLIAGLVSFTFFGSFTEFFVYRGYVKAFCMLFIKGFFNSIDNQIYTREASAYLLEQLKQRKNLTPEEKSNRKKELKYATKDDLTEQDKKNLRKSFRQSRMVKRVLVCCSIPLAIASGIGFMGLVFSQIVAVLPLLGILSGGAFIAIPFVLITGPLFAVVMFGMMYKAIKNNIFAKMRHHLKTFLYKPPKDQPDLTFGKLKWNQKLAHFAKGVVKIFGVVFVLGVSFLATAFTAQAWLESSVKFFVFLGKQASNLIGTVVGLVFLGTTYFFSVEKGLQTVAALFVPFTVLRKKIHEAITDLKHDPKQFFTSALSNIGYGIKNIVLHPLETLKAVAKALVQSFFVVHIIGSSAVTSQGSEAFALSNWFGTDPMTNKGIAGGVELLEESMVDGYDVGLHKLLHKQHAHPDFPHFQHYHHKKHKHDHEHGNLWKFGKQCFESLILKIGIFSPVKTAEGNVTKLVTPGMRLRAR